MKIYNGIVIALIVLGSGYLTYDSQKVADYDNNLITVEANKRYATYVKQDLTETNEIYPYTYDTASVETIIAEPQVELVDDKEYYQENGLSWLIRKVQDGIPTYELKTELLTYNNDEQLLSKVVIPDSVTTIEGQPELYAYGAAVAEGAYFKTTRITTYGVDCVGCSGEKTGYGNFASGVSVSTTAVLQSNGVWKDGITYDGYYIIAADSSIPLCTVVEISNHSISGSGIVAGEPFQAIVLDRGGAIDNGHIDFFEGSQKDGINKIVSRKSSGVQVTIIDFNTRVRNGCRIS